MATSGNVCTVTPTSQGFLLDWQNPQTAEDQQEFLQWANSNLGPALREKLSEIIPIPTLNQALADPTLPRHLHAFLQASLPLHPLVAWHDAQLAADILKARYLQSEPQN